MAPRDTVGRFTSRVRDYVRYRPGYPIDIVQLLQRECGLTAQWKVADIGSGTGFLTKLFLEAGCTTYGVDPNAGMRAAAEELLRRYPHFHSIDGRSDATGLDTASINLVAAGQAFHWFDPLLARAEFQRILKPGGWVVLAWNERLTSTPFLKAYDELLLRHSPEYSEVDHRRIGADEITSFFGHNSWKRALFPNAQHFNPDELKGRSQSSSYVPLEGMPGHDEIMRGLDDLFARYNEDGRVTFLYDTTVYYGTLGEARTPRTI